MSQFIGDEAKTLKIQSEERKKSQREEEEAVIQVGILPTF